MYKATYRYDHRIEEKDWSKNWQEFHLFKNVRVWNFYSAFWNFNWSKVLIYTLNMSTYTFWYTQLEFLSHSKEAEAAHALHWRQ